ncbi:MAG: ATP-dependent helicase [Candidatus Electrothrix sp. AW1]|nr:ATP-dependent helicase [Candidatus Electrothrix sp. AX1]MCI5179567.1 ATP-dependent helicase [Candidatus Electrothrix gigas]MCI5183649.1 ATP-dependent helicase [Candidatus Electrothrix gigas]
MTQLSPAEQEAINALEKIKFCIDKNQCFRLEAGAGAGKTYSLIESIRYIIEKKANELLKKEQQIACITYTNVAKDEIKDRTDHHPVIFADTIHSFCWSILQNYQVKMRELIADLNEKWNERINEAGGITNQIVKYDLGYPSINEKEISLHHDDVVVLMSRMLSYPKFQKLLRSKFPIILIDEYQDTDKKLAASIASNIIDNDSGVIVGLFGDHWQKIYGSSACGLISSNAGKLNEIGKKANFRSDKNIVSCLNRMRPDLPQAESNPASQGVIKVFHSNSWDGTRRDGKGGGHWKGDLPPESAKNYIDKVKELMVADGWDISSTNTKILLLTNNLIANEQNFKNLADCFRYTDDYLKQQNNYIKFFLDIIEPTISAFESCEYGKIFQVGGKNHPQLQCQKDKKIWSDNLKKLKTARNQKNIGEVLDLLFESKTPQLSAKVEQSTAKFRSLQAKVSEELEEEDKRFLDKIHKIQSVSYQEVVNLDQYIEEKTPFSTKHGVKGAQFSNVLVVFGRGWNRYNWSQLLEWMEDGYPNDKQEMYERNRNLFYVCCSRAKHNLTLLFTQELSGKALSVVERIFGQDNVLGDPF